MHTTKKITVRGERSVDKKERIKADIIDNFQKGITMATVLNSEIPHINKFDVSTGYFNIGGYVLLQESLTDAIKNDRFAMRLLLGKEAILPTESSFEKYAQQYQQVDEDSTSIKTNLEKHVIDTKLNMHTKQLIEFLEHNSIQVRLGTNRFNHSKCYILGSNSVFVGSSNFTQGGLTKNYELNAGLYQPGVAKQTREWFERMWGESNDVKQALIDVLKQSKFGVPAPPFEIYVKMLFERFLPQIGEMKDDVGATMSDLTQFQKDAVKIGLSIIAEYNGVLIADSTGLGKTNMGISILRHKIYNERKRAILIAPAQVKDSMWVEKLKDEDLSVRYILTHHELSRFKIEDFAKFRKIDFVLIDESQGFRSHNAKRRDKLMTLLDTGKRKEVVLLSATPINNSLMDLYYQLLLITGDEPSYFANSVGITNLYKHMREAADKNKKMGLEKIQQLLDTIMIRRTRSYIQEIYPKDKINGVNLKFPKHNYAPIQYSLSTMYPNLFQDMATESGRLTMAPYGIDYYNTTLSKKERDKSRITAHLQMIMLLKRFESSIAAGKISVDNKIIMYKHVLKVLEDGNGKILKVVDFNKIMQNWNLIDDGENLDYEHEADEQEETFIEKIKNVKLVDGKNYNVSELKDDIKTDLNVLKNMQSRLANVKLDTKLNSVYKQIMLDRALEKNEGKSGKVLIFTEYAATARYILEKLGGTIKGGKKQAKRKNGELVRNNNGLLPLNIKIEIITGETTTKERRKRIREFAPVANSTEDEPFVGEEIDVLVSTEILSEGQNLQDCNYVINYDLPWNPMRIVQRTGRVDRLTSTYDVIYSRACYPDKELDRLLNLMGTLAHKIRTVDDTIGDEGSILGISMTPRTTKGGITERLMLLSQSGEHESIMSELQREADMMPTTSLMNFISGHIKKIGIDKMNEVPMGRRSGKKGDEEKAVLAYLQEKPHRHVHFVLYSYRTGKASVVDETEAVKYVRCEKNEQAYLPMDSQNDSQKSFEELVRIDQIARKSIQNKNIQIMSEKLRGDDAVGKKRKRIVLEMERSITTAFADGQISSDEADRVLDIVKDVRVNRKDKEIESLLLDYKKTKNITNLVSEVLSIAKLLFLDDRKKCTDSSDELYANPELVLIGALFVSSEKHRISRDVSKM